MPTGYIPILQIKTKDGKWLPVNAIGGQVASKVLYNNAYPTVEQALDYLFENGTGGGGGGTGGASTAANVSYTNTQLPNVKNVKTALDELVPDSHNHNNKNILDKFAESNGKPTYDGQAIGGGASTAEDISYTLSEDVQNEFPDLAVLESNTVKSGLDLAIYYAFAGLLAKNISFDVQAPGGTFSISLQDLYDYSILPAVEKAHEHDNMPVLNNLSVSNGKLQYNGSDISVTKDNVVAALGYTPEAESAKVYTGSNITLEDNTEYRLTAVTTLNLTYPTGRFECWMRLTFAASGEATVILPTGTKYIGTTPDFKNGETWEMSIKDGVVIAQKVGDGSMTPIETVEDGTEVSY